MDRSYPIPAHPSAEAGPAVPNKALDDDTRELFFFIWRAGKKMGQRMRRRISR